MVKVLLEGHSFNHDLFELIRVFFPNDEIGFIETYEEGKEELTIVSSLRPKFDKYLAICKIYSKDSLLKETIIDINNININGFPREKIIKNSIKKSIYDSLITLVDFHVPWGILTGIRPTKLTHDLINISEKDSFVQDILVNEFRLHEKKAKLLIDIANIQRKYIYPLDKDKYSLYVGIPFCPSRCSYCSFPSFAIGNDYNKVSNYVDTLIQEIKAIKEMMSGKFLNTVYIGGGTPTSIKVKDLERIIFTIKESFKGEDIKEFTVEAGRPDTLNTDMLKMLKSMEIDRISINPQTMNDKTLSKIGRNHNIKSIISSYNLAKELEFDIINMDIILGLPGEGIEDIINTLYEIEKLNPDNLTVHALSLKRGSGLSNQRLNIEKSNLINKMLQLTEDKSHDMGMSPYYLYRQKQILGNLENIGYSKLNKECIYNISMMEERETIIGAGLGAVSKFYYPDENRIERLPNFKSLIDYSSRINELILKKESFISK